jgi:hypothetical protein
VEPLDHIADAPDRIRRCGTVDTEFFEWLSERLASTESSYDNNMSATVRPEKLREALYAKLGVAGESLYEIRQSERAEINRFNDARRYIGDFLHAARGVYPVAETFLKPAKFKKWFEPWEKNRLSDSERALWGKIRIERVSQEHGEGVGLIAVSIPIPRAAMSPSVPNVAHLHLAATGYQGGESSKGGERFRAYPDKPASEVCAEYLKLANRFVEDFLREQGATV